jgi:hypothetical protein
MNVLPITVQLGAVKTAQSTATDHADLHAPSCAIGCSELQPAK